MVVINTKSNKKKLIIGLIILAVLVTGIVIFLTKKDSSKNVIKTADDLIQINGKCAIITGTVEDTVVDENFPQLKKAYYSSSGDCVGALQSNKIDCYMCEAIMAKQISGETGLDIVPTGIYEIPLAYIFPKDAEYDAIYEEYNNYVKEILKNGFMQKTIKKWDVSDMSSVKMDKFKFDGKKGVLKAGICSTLPPFTFVQDNEYAGLDMEVFYKFCQEHGYKPEIYDVDFNGLIAGVSTGKYTIGMSGITPTDERKESVRFSEGYYSDEFKFLVNNGTKNVGFVKGLKDSFNKTFIKEHRYKKFISGISVTLLISILSILLGTILGFLLFLPCRNGEKYRNKLLSFYCELIDRLPEVVMLLILCYIVFRRSDISGVVISIMGFTLLFSSNVVGILRNGVTAVGKDQMEGAIALGYTNRQAFFKIILPQAMRFMLPQYKGGIVSLIKGTAIVGYVAVSDLTRVGDIIRSRTYEPFFPIIIVAVIYLLIIVLVIRLISAIEINTDPKKRSKDKIMKRIK